MSMSRRKYLNGCLFIVTLIIAVSCRHPRINADKAFYYWRSNFSLSEKDKSYLQNVAVSKLYLHFFDVSWNDEYNKVLPVDEIKFDSTFTNTFQYVPVVFIANKALDKTPLDSIDELSRHILNEVSHIAGANNVNFKELQFDCDWTDGTRRKYFDLLTYFHKEMNQAGKLLSATIRLHQIKYAEKTGVPPVDRGMLMFYNMGKINSVPGYNSIYNTRDANNYASHIASYPLPLDIALPVFGWAICVREGKVTGIIEKAVDKDFSDTSMFSSGGTDIFVSHKAFFFHGKYFMKNDTVKLEQVTPDLCKSAAENAGRYLKDERRTVTLFDYDSIYLTNYDKKDLEKIFSLSN